MSPDPLSLLGAICLSRMPRQPFGPGSKAGHSTETRHTPASSRRDYRAVSSVIDADSEDEEEVVERFGNKRLGQNVQDGKQRVLNTNPNTHCQPSHPSKTQYLSNHIIDENQPSSTHPLSWNRNPQYKEVKERFKYTDTNGTDLWACVKTVYDADGRHVFLLEDDEPAMEVEMYPAGGRSYYDREDYPNQTKYWRDHHVPEYSIERLKPYVLRDAYVPEYSRLSARAQAWRGFTKPTLNLMQRLSTPLGHYNRSSSQAKYYSSQREYLAGHKRSFHKYRNRQRTKRFNERTKINLATFVASPSTERDMHIDSNVVNNTNEIPDNLHAIIIENLPEELTASYVKVSFFLACFRKNKLLIAST